MLILLFLFSVLNLSLSVPIAVPGTESDNEPMTVYGCQLPECINIARYRTVQGIVLSCLATIFACTWVAIHPNLPGLWDSGRTKLKRKVVTAIYAVLAPEYLAMWALRQWMAARRIALEFNVKHHGADAPSHVPWYTNIRRAPRACWTALSATAVEWWRGPERDAPNDWTLTHGFFIQMGGFMLYEGKRPIRVLTFDDLVEMIDKGLVEVPDVTEKDINDKSKGEFLTKLVAVLQTTWFSFQCLGRWATDLPVTELEVATLAFAVLNVVTYGLWWRKPQSTEVAVRIPLKSEVMDVTDVRNKAEGTTEARRPLEGGYEQKESRITERLRDAVGKGWAGCLFRVPFALFKALLRPIQKMITDNGLDLPHGSLRLPMFYADRWEAHDMIPVTVAGALFGSFHLFLWSSVFPSAAELTLWRVSALLITAHPLLFILSLVAEPHSEILSEVLEVTYVVTLPFYYFARLTLLTLAFATLRALPQDAYTAIEWATFIPHL